MNNSLLIGQEQDTESVEDINCLPTLESDDSDDDLEEIPSPLMDVGLEINFDFAVLNIGDFVAVKLVMSHHYVIKLVNFY